MLGKKRLQTRFYLQNKKNACKRDEKRYPIFTYMLLA